MNKKLISFLSILALSLSFISIPANAADYWKIGDIKKELVIEYSHDNSIEQCGLTNNKFTINYTSFDRDVKKGAFNYCFLNIYLPITIVSKTTDINFSQFVSNLYYEVLVNKKWEKTNYLNYFPQSEVSGFLEESIAQRIPILAPENSVNSSCEEKGLGKLSYIAKSTINLRVAVMPRDKSLKVLYSKPFTVSYENHPQEWLKTCPIGSVNTPIPVESTGDATGQQNISCPIIGQPVKYDFVQDPPYEDDRTIKLKISNSSSCAITVAVSGQVVCQHRPAAFQSILRYNRTIVFSKVTSNIFKPKTTGFITISALFPSNSVTYKDCDRSPIPIEPQTKLPTKTKLIGPYLVYDTGKDTLSVVITTAEKQ